jgi:hypothetical protein
MRHAGLAVKARFRALFALIAALPHKPVNVLVAEFVRRGCLRARASLTSPPVRFKR